MAARVNVPLEIVRRYLPQSREAIGRQMLADVATYWQDMVDAHPGLLSESFDRSGKTLSPAAAIALVLRALGVARANQDAGWLSEIGHQADNHLKQRKRPLRPAWKDQRKTLCEELREVLQQKDAATTEIVDLAATVVLRHAFLPGSRPAGLLAAAGVLPPEPSDVPAILSNLQKARAGIVRGLKRQHPGRADVENVIRKALLALGLPGPMVKNLFDGHKTARELLNAPTVQNIVQNGRLCRYRGIGQDRMR